MEHDLDRKGGPGAGAIDSLDSPSGVAAAAAAVAIAVVARHNKEEVATQPEGITLVSQR